MNCISDALSVRCPQDSRLEAGLGPPLVGAAERRTLWGEDARGDIRGWRRRRYCEGACGKAREGGGRQEGAPPGKWGQESVRGHSQRQRQARQGWRRFSKKRSLGTI